MRIHYKLLAAQEADLLVSAIERVYGTTYPVPEFYDRAYLESALRSGSLHTVVAMAGDELAGCMSTVLEQAGDYTADGSALMVAPEYRGQGITGRIGEKMMDVYSRLGLGGLHLYALALHDRVQNQSGAAGAVVTGVLPAWFSRNARVAGYDYPDARIGAVCLYMPLTGLPARVSYLPAPYAPVLGDIYDKLGLVRELAEVPHGIAMPAVTVCSVEEKLDNGQLRLRLHRVGEDVSAVLVAQVSAMALRGLEVLYLDIPLSDPGAGEAVSRAREQGFFFGALMVERRGCDQLRMQLFDPVCAAPQSMVLATEQARQLLQFALDDRP